MRWLFRKSELEPKGGISAPFDASVPHIASSSSPRMAFCSIITWYNLGNESLPKYAIANGLFKILVDGMVWRLRGQGALGCLGSLRLRKIDEEGATRPDTIKSTPVRMNMLLSFQKT